MNKTPEEITASTEATNRYKAFRNYMTNELGITRQDIEAWTKQSVATEVAKKIGQLNIEGMALNAVQSAARSACGINGGYISTNSALVKSIAEELSSRIQLQLAPPK